MKQILLLITSALMVFASCKKDDNPTAIYTPDNRLENKAGNQPYMHFNYAGDSSLTFTRIEESYMFGAIYNNVFKQGITASFDRNDTTYCLRINFVIDKDQREFMDGFALQPYHVYSLKESPSVALCDMTKGVEVEWYAHHQSLQGGPVTEDDFYFHYTSADVVQKKDPYFEIYGFRKEPPDGKFTWIKGGFRCDLNNNGISIPVFGEFQGRFYLN